MRRATYDGPGSKVKVSDGMWVRRSGVNGVNGGLVGLLGATRYILVYDGISRYGFLHATQMHAKLH